MGSRPLPLILALAALAADAVGLHRAAFYVVLLAVPAAAAAAFVAVSDALERRCAWPRAGSLALALTLLVTASAVRENAPHAAAVPAAATSALVAATLLYGLSFLGWLLEPVRAHLPAGRGSAPVEPATEP
jgi:hypothetical protein